MKAAQNRKTQGALPTFGGAGCEAITKRILLVAPHFPEGRSRHTAESGEPVKYEADADLVGSLILASDLRFGFNHSRRFPTAARG
jgi:hypothetical protein